MKKVLFITASDLHFADWGQFNEDGRRITAHLDVWGKLEAQCIKHNVPLLMPGDWFHNPKNLSNRLLNMVLPVLVKTKINKIFGIDGNHDQDGISTLDKKPYGYMNLLSQLSDSFINCNFTTEYHDNCAIHGIPYLTHNIGFVKNVESIKLNDTGYNILMIHTDLPGAVDTNGREVGTSEGLTKQYSKLFARFDLVLAGHIHKPQQLASNVLMVGAPQQQNRGDRKCEFGYWKIYDDLSFKFFEIKSPKFKTAESNDSTDSYNYWTISHSNKKDKKVFKSSPKKTERGAINNYIKDSGIKKHRAKFLKTLLNKAKND